MQGRLGPERCNSVHAVYTPAMLRIDNLTYRIGDRVLFNGASAVVNAGTAWASSAATGPARRRCSA